MFKRSYGKKEGTSIARSTPRRSEVSLKDSCSLGAGRSWKRENKKKRERKREDFSTARKSASLLAFLPSPSYACSFTLANSLTLTLFSFFSSSSPRFLSFLPFEKEMKLSSRSILPFLFSLSFLSRIPFSLSLFLTLSLKCNSSFDRLHRNPFPFFPFILLLRPSFFTKRSKISSHARLITAIFSFPCKTEPCGRRFEEIYVYDGTINFVSSTCHCTVES